MKIAWAFIPAIILAASVCEARAQSAAPAITADAFESPPAAPPVAAPDEAPPADTKAATESLTRTLSLAYAYHPRLKAERELLKATDEEVAVALSAFRPFITGGYEKGRQRTRSGGASWNYGDTETKEAVVEQPIFTGSSLPAFRAAKARVKAGRARLLAAEQGVLLEAATAYADVLERQAVVELSANNAAVLKRQLDATQARFDVGELTRTDIAQATARLSIAQADLRQARANLDAARAAYQRAAGTQPANIGVSPLLPPVPATLAEAVRLGEEVNPDLEQARFAEKAAGSDVYARAGDLLPDVTLRGTTSRTEGLRGVVGGLSQYDSDTLTLNVTIPLYQSGAEYARLRAARKLEEQARFTSREVSDAVVSNVTSAYESFAASESVIASMQASVRAAEEALSGVRLENESGTRTILEVLDAEQELFLNRVNLTRAERNRLVLAFQLLAACGQLTAEKLHLPVELYDPRQHYDRVWWLPLGF